MPSIRRAPLVGAAIVLATAGAITFSRPVVVAADGSFDSEMFQLINQDRAANGVAPLAWNSELAGIGEGNVYDGCGYPVRGRAEDMIDRDYFSHTITNCNNETVFTVMRSDGIDYTSTNAGENIGWSSGLTDPVQAAIYQNTLYMRSTPHRANILNPLFNEVGVGSWATLAGQMWSGGGTALGNVFVSAVEFVQVTGTSPNWPTVRSIGTVPKATPPVTSSGTVTMPRLGMQRDVRAPAAYHPTGVAPPPSAARQRPSERTDNVLPIAASLSGRLAMATLEAVEARLSGELSRGAWSVAGSRSSSRGWRSPSLKSWKTGRRSRSSGLPAIPGGHSPATTVCR